MIYCSRCGGTYEDSLYEAHLVTCVLRSRLFRHVRFRRKVFGKHHTDAQLRSRAVVRRPDFTSPESPTVAPVTQADRIDGGLRARRIRTVHIPLEAPTVQVRSSRLKRIWERIKS